MKKLAFLSGVALLALGSSAFAQQATGLYVSAGVGANWLDDGTLSLDFNPPVGNVDSFD